MMRNPPIARIVTVNEIVTPFWPLENVTIMNGDSMFQGHTRSLKTKNSMKIKKGERARIDHSSNYFFCSEQKFLSNQKRFSPFSTNL